jgi:hypothetical protein
VFRSSTVTTAGSASRPVSESPIAFPDVVARANAPLGVLVAKATETSRGAGARPDISSERDDQSSRFVDNRQIPEL